VNVSRYWIPAFAWKDSENQEDHLLSEAILPKRDVYHSLLSRVKVNSILETLIPCLLCTFLVWFAVMGTTVVYMHFTLKATDTRFN
jgi:hypothetical protein